MFLRNGGNHLKNYMASQLRRPNSKSRDIVSVFKAFNLKRHFYSKDKGHRGNLSSHSRGSSARDWGC
jgi:hypothetical protein